MVKSKAKKNAKWITKLIRLVQDCYIKIGTPRSAILREEREAILANYLKQYENVNIKIVGGNIYIYIANENFCYCFKNISDDSMYSFDDNIWLQITNKQSHQPAYCAVLIYRISKNYTDEELTEYLCTLPDMDVIL